MNRRFAVIVLTGGVLAMSFIGGLRTILDQRKEIARLRAELETRDVHLESAAQIFPDPLALQPQAASTLTSAQPSVPVGTVLQEEARATNTESALLQQRNQKLEEELRAAKEQLMAGKEVAGPEKKQPPPYIGPGTWIKEPYDGYGTRKVVIRGRLDRARASPDMTIDWGPGEVPLLMVQDRTERGSMSGFALWDGQKEWAGGWREFAIVNFGNDGLKVELIRTTTQPLVEHYSTVTRLVRVE